MKFFYSAASRGFHLKEPFGAPIPADAVAVTPARHRALLDAQAEGAEIVPGADGRPKLAWPSTNLAARRAAAVAAVKAQARRRILAIASAHRQSNDNAAMAQAALELQVAGATTVEFEQALCRRRGIDALRAAAGELAAAIRVCPAAELDAFDAAADDHWS